jgi:hypothetical protein
METMSWALSSSSEVNTISTMVVESTIGLS